MIFGTPRLASTEQRAIERIEQLRVDLEHVTREPRRWSGNLCRMAFARAVQGSNSIEGYNASLDDVAAALDEEEPLDADEETAQALAGYRDAMTYVLQNAVDTTRGSIDDGLIKALHFMMLRHDLTKSPGQWRRGEIFVRREPTGDIVYTGPDAAAVPSLTHELTGELDVERHHPLVCAALAHLNLVMIHPFREGNGRMGRCLQTLVLAREQILAPVFSSIEEYLGRNTNDYYEILQQVGAGSWQPERDARPWVRFCLTAHYRQARTHLRRHEELAALWLACAQLIEERGLPERTIGVTLEAALGLRLRNATLRRIVETTHGSEVSALTASRDLKALVDSGLLRPVGERRARRYLATLKLTECWQRIRAARPARSDDDPFAETSEQLELDGSGAQPA